MAEGPLRNFLFPQVWGTKGVESAIPGNAGGVLLALPTLSAPVVHALAILDRAAGFNRQNQKASLQVGVLILPIAYQGGAQARSG